ncbi:DUF4167 domain-containing protein [Emcibacter sp.]|uniref:DUF4167 domain-containing protein n=1 Tax=Emcibacter sp. TaxID=1979954 RepID=UPI003A908B20
MKQNQNPRRGRQSGKNTSNQQRGKNGGKGRKGKGGSQPQGNAATRQVDSHGPLGKQRGNAKQLYEKYKTLARETFANDRMTSESLSQFADHYYRIYAEHAAGEAAAQAAREEEQKRRAEEAAENQANLVEIANDTEEGGKAARASHSDDGGDKDKPAEILDLDLGENGEGGQPEGKPKRRTPPRSRKKMDSEAEELPLEDTAKKPARRGRAKKAETEEQQASE